MVKNTGTWDRVARISLGAVALSLVFWGPKTAWGWAGLIFIGTGLAGTCPIYMLMGMDTCPMDRNPD